MKILVCGDRNWTDRRTIERTLSRFVLNEVTIIHGNARGADTWAALAAEQLGFTVIPVDADWERYGRAAGPIRNRWMLAMEPDLVLAFHNDLSQSKGTADTIKEATRRGIPVGVISTRGE